MKISPEPLAPLRNWRELWHLKPLDCENTFRPQTVYPQDIWKQPKRTGFSWFTHLFSRTSHR